MRISKIQNSRLVITREEEEPVQEVKQESNEQEPKAEEESRDEEEGRETKQPEENSVGPSQEETVVVDIGASGIDGGESGEYAAEKTD